MQIARLQRSCHRLIWLNPLIGTADYAPLTRGLQAALPFVDDFLPVAHVDQSRGSRATLERARSRASTGTKARQAMDISGTTHSMRRRSRVGAAAWIRPCSRRAFRAASGSSPTATIATARRSPSVWRRSPAPTTAWSCSRQGPDSSYRFRSRAGPAGFVKGSSAIALRAEGAATIVDVSERADRRHDRAARSAPDRRRREDDAGSLLRLLAVEADGSLNMRERAHDTVSESSAGL